MIHWYMWKYPGIHCFGCIIIRGERKSEFLRTKTGSRSGGNMEMVIVSILSPYQRLKVKGDISCVKKENELSHLSHPSRGDLDA